VHLCSELVVAVYACMQVCACVGTCVCVCVCVCMDGRVSECVWMHVCVDARVCVDGCVYVSPESNSRSDICSNSLIHHAAERTLLPSFCVRCIDPEGVDRLVVFSSKDQQDHAGQLVRWRCWCGAW
jgi:hypothetical protein